ncbi:hypothetical protein Vqi01_12600 [Micromonospora qiuiae]|uniref:Nucleotidyltransferase n=1 Tax=Micromonospora qiuiae TaxID=502268 RepID=A0ABQ4J7E9_9ACTN|nr:hypothetical protein Vqi01_12600 [Micromonospora qiuiae]
MWEALSGVKGVRFQSEVSNRVGRDGLLRSWREDLASGNVPRHDRPGCAAEQPGRPATNELGFPQHGRYLLDLDEVKAAFVEAEIFQSSTTRRDCWQGLLNYLQMWRSFEDRLGQTVGDEGLIISLWLGGSFISTVKLDPRNVDLVVFIDGGALTRADEQGIRHKTQISKLTSRGHLERLLRVTPTVVPYYYPGTPWQRDPYGGDQQQYLVMRGCLDDWWTRTRPEGEARGAPTPESGKWVRGYVEVRLT